MPETPNIKSRELPEAPRDTRPAPVAYAELDVTTNFSFLRGASHPDEMVFRAAELGYRAIAITDRNSLAGVVRAHDAVRLVKEQGGVPPKLIIGARLTFTDVPDVLVWPTDRKAYARFCRLLTLGKRRAEKGQCLLHLSDLLENNAGLLAAVCYENQHPTSNIQHPTSNETPPTSTFDVRCSMFDVAVSSKPHLRLHQSPHALLRESFGPRLSLAACAL